MTPESLEVMRTLALYGLPRKVAAGVFGDPADPEFLAVVDAFLSPLRNPRSWARVRAELLADPSMSVRRAFGRTRAGGTASIGFDFATGEFRGGVAPPPDA